MDVGIEKDNGWTRTTGLSPLGMQEIGIWEERPAWRDSAEALILFVASYVTSSGAIIEPDETMNYGSWLIRFHAGDLPWLEVQEYDETGTHFISGASLAMRLWREQQEVCQGSHAPFEAPRADKLVAISEDIVGGGDAEGVRYNQGGEMSGWIITSPGYDGSVKSLSREHLYHLVALRPDL